MHQTLLLAVVEATQAASGNQFTDLAQRFGVDGPKFFSQVIAFTIIMFCLKKFAFTPILQVLDERRKRIADSLTNADKIKQQLAEAEVRYQEILNKANAEAQQMIDEARTSSGIISEKGRQQAITEAEQIISKARQATALEHSQMLSQLKRELGRLVIDTTTKVTGKVLTPDDQNRLNEETARQVSA